MDTLHNRSPRLRAALAGAGAAALAAGAGIVALTTVPASAATPACAVTYAVSSQWNNGFGANITIVDNAAPINGWTLGFSFAAGQTVTQGWNGTWSQSGANVTVAGPLETGTPVQLVPLSAKSVGTGLLPVQEPLKPTCTEPPVAIEAFQLRFVTVTFAPLWVQVPFQPWVTVCPAAKEKPSVQPLIADELLTMLMLAPKPPGH